MTTADEIDAWQAGLAAHTPALTEAIRSVFGALAAGHPQGSDDGPIEAVLAEARPVPHGGDPADAAVVVHHWVGATLLALRPWVDEHHPGSRVVLGSDHRGVREVIWAPWVERLNPPAMAGGRSTTTFTARGSRTCGAGRLRAWSGCAARAGSTGTCREPRRPSGSPTPTSTPT